MGEAAKTTAFYYSFVLLLVLLLLAANVTAGRSLLSSSSSTSELVLDGIIERSQEKPSSILSSSSSDDDGVYYCCCNKQVYGFLPCASSGSGHLFLILVYEYLLFHGESYVVSGGEQIFKILGPGVFGASAFHVLGALPESIILLASGLLNGKEIAQEHVKTGVGLLAGSSIFLLTLLWGTCLIVAGQKLPDNNNNNNTTKFNTSSAAISNSSQNKFTKLLSPLIEYGIATDLETTYTSRIMVVSVVPFIIIQIPRLFGLSPYGEKVVIAITLLISVGLLLLYFFYQIFEPWIQKRRLEYVKHEHLVVDILKRMQKHTMQKLLTDDGAPDVAAITRVFEEMDRDGNNYVSYAELKQLLHEIIRDKKGGAYQDDKTAAEMMKEFDLDDDKKITLHEFIGGFTRWIDETKDALHRRYHSVRSLKDLYQILQPWIRKKRKEHELKKHLISEINLHAQSSENGSLLADDGTPDKTSIEKLFHSVDLDGDNCLSEAELKQLIVISIQFGNIPWDADEAAAEIMEELDANGDQAVSEDEFITGFTKLLGNQASCKSSADDIYRMTWEQTDLLVDERSIDRSYWGWAKALLILGFGVVMLALLAEPLISSVQNLSAQANIPSFFISFVLVPLATNARGAISAIAASRRKKPRTTSLTFSEIYGGVFMNNVLSFSVLLSLIYFRGLAWDFSAEALVVLMVCTTMGFAASFCSTFSIWASLVAFLLYPSSLLLVFLLNSLI